MNKEDVKSFYNDFLESRMLRYRLDGNPRLDMAAERILPYLTKHCNVLDIGCGIGIIPERMASVATSGQIWATDLSERNIWYARQTVDAANITFFAADILDNFESVRKHVDKPVDVVTMIDVIEHLPKAAHPTLFQNLRDISTRDALVILTYPSPQYQRYLQEHDPDHMQIIDQVIELEELLDAVQPAGYGLKHFSLEAVKFENQYVHCVLQADNSLSPPPEPKLLRKLVRRIQGTLRRRILVPLRRRKYIDQVFGP